MDYVRTEVISDKYTDDENSDVLSEFQGSVLWTKRSLLYRLSFLTLLPLFAVFLLGFSSPFWMRKNQVDKYRGYYNIREKVDVSIGLWRVCEGTGFSDITDCTVIPDVTHYIVVCQTMLCLCLIFTVFSLIFGLYENCATRYDVDEGTNVRTKRPEMNAVTAGLFGLTGIGMYGTSIINATRSGDGAVHWAFLVTAASVMGVIICGILMAIANPINSTVQRFPGQSMSLSRQNSLKSCEPNDHNRLVSSGDGMVQLTGFQASGTTYGVTGSNFDINEVQFLQRSESYLSSLDASAEISQALDISDDNKNTYIVEAHDIHVHTRDSRRQKVKQHSKETKKQSRHFDDINCRDIIEDFKDNPPSDVLPTEGRADIKRKNGHFSVSLGNETPTSSVKPNGPSIGEIARSEPDETADLMLLDDLLEDAAALNKHHNSHLVFETKDVHMLKSNKHQFMEDNVVAPPQVLNDLQRSTISSGSWEQQPWPDPPTESEILGQTVMPMSLNNSSDSRSPAAINSEPQLKTGPESNQLHSHGLTTHSKRHSQGEDSKVSYKTLRSNDAPIKSSKGSQGKEGRRSASKKSHTLSKTLLPVKTEYDNPLFKSQPLDGERPLNASIQVCESASFVLSLAEQPSLPTHAGTLPNRSISRKTHSTQNANCSASDIEDRHDSSTHLSNGKICDISPPTYNRYGKKIAEDSTKKHSVFKDRSEYNKTQHQHQCFDDTSKREQEERRSGHLDSELTKHQKLISQQRGRNDSSSQPASKLPRLGLRRQDIAETGNTTVNSSEVQKGKVKAKTTE